LCGLGEGFCDDCGVRWFVGVGGSVGGGGGWPEKKGVKRTEKYDFLTFRSGPDQAKGGLGVASQDGEPEPFPFKENKL